MKPDRLCLICLGAVAALCVLCAALIPLFSRPGACADILRNGTLLRTVSLDEPGEFPAPAPNGGRNTIPVRDGLICVSHATCPDQVCVRQGWVNTDMTPIVCLPNGLVIQITGGDRELDGQTG